MQAKSMSSPVFSRTLIALSWAWIVWFQGSAVSAATLDWLYEVTLPVVTQAEDERNQMIRDGMQIVLHRVTGLDDLPSLAKLDEALDDAETYQLEYRYEEDPEGIFDASTQSLVVTFDENAIRSLVRSLDLPIWTAQRPHVIFIFSVEVPEGRTILGSTSNHMLQPLIEGAASRRGLEIRHPLMDLTDIRSLSRGSIAFDFFMDPASLMDRYDVDLLVTARADRLAFGKFRVTMRSVQSNSEQVDVFDVPDFMSVATEVVNRTADSVAGRFAVVGESESSLTLVVRGILSLADYKNVIDYLEKWEFIDHVLLRSVERDRFEFELLTASSWDQFMVHLDAEKQLQPTYGSGIMSFEVMEFTWLGSQ